MRDLIIIPARGGSKGIPVKTLNPLMADPSYTILGCSLCSCIAWKHLCSTESDEIIRNVRKYGLDVPFKRPEYLATDTASSYDVIRHAIEFYEKKGMNYDCVLLLQPTSPLRTAAHIREALSLYQAGLDMVVSVKLPVQTHISPFLRRQWRISNAVKAR